MQSLMGETPKTALHRFRYGAYSMKLLPESLTFMNRLEKIYKLIFPIVERSCLRVAQNLVCPLPYRSR
ncbi:MULTISPECIES: hypothetical protein [unclassified Moorena]|uniref:hypothetical protein n=1 Tax=unclassified Moorena TaxID=2683338 RepID=UPI001400673B|nr:MULTISPECIES: hypothetical protein [unclassified Moorena]NEO15906.1 hypothetical protein [Moorena sp. SIO3E8]NEQ02278.1 hypothetical protein [Moorena sp. SIO3F7]